MGNFTQALLIAAAILVALTSGGCSTHYTINVTQVTPAQGDALECMTDAECEQLDDNNEPAAQAVTWI